MNSSDIPVKRKIEPGALFKISRMKEQIKPTRPHRHDGYFEIIILEDGAGFHVIDDHQNEVVSPMVFWLKPGQVHCWNFTRIPRGYVILFREELFSGSNLKNMLFNFPSLSVIKKEPGIFRFLDLLYDDFQQALLTPEMLSSYLDILLHKLNQNLENPVYLSNDRSDLLFRFKSMLEKEFLTHKSVQYYASQLNLTAKKLNGICRDHYHRNAQDLIQERLLLEIKNQLLHTSEGISRIGDVMGFHDPSHFVRFFRQKTGLTPGQFRKKAQ